MNHIVVASSDELKVDDVHGLAIVLERRDAIIPALKLDAVAVGEVALQDVVRLAVAREVIVDRADRGHLENDVPGMTRRLQHVITVKAQHLDVIFIAQMQALDQIHLVVEYVEVVHVCQTGERILLYNAQVALLNINRMHVRQTVKSIGLQSGQIHVAELEQTDMLEAIEGVLLDHADARREDEIVDVGEAGKRVAADGVQRIVAQQDQIHIGGAGKRVALDEADLIVGKQ